MKSTATTTMQSYATVIPLQYDHNTRYKLDIHGNIFVTKTKFGPITIIPIKNICFQVGCLDITLHNADSNLQAVVHFNMLIKSI